MKIFIASSSERESDAEHVAEMLSELGCEPKFWKDGGVFVAGEYTLESLSRMAREVDAAVFLLMPDDRLQSRGQELLSPRDNVVLEYGLFTGVLGCRKCVILTRQGTKIASDLAGLTRIPFEPEQPYSTKRRLKEWLDSIKATALNRPQPACGDDAISGRWVGEGEDLYVANGEATTKFQMDAQFRVVGQDWNVTIKVNRYQNSNNGHVPQQFELVASGSMNWLGVVSLYYKNPNSTVPHHGVFYLEYIAYPEGLVGHFAGFSSRRKTVVAGKLSFSRDPRAVLGDVHAAHLDH